MQKTLKGHNGITEGVIWQQLLIFFFPMLFGTFFQQLYNTVAAIVLGKFVGKEALAAVGGSTATIMNLFLNFFIGLSSGVSVTIAQFYGAKEGLEVKRAVHTAAAIALAGGIIFTVVGFISAPSMLRLMGTPKEIMPYSISYIRIFFIGITTNLIYNMGAGILRAIGDSKRPLYYLIISSFVNIILILLFVIVFHWGIVGTAIAMVIAQGSSATLIIITLINADDCYRVNIKEIFIHKDMLNRIFKIGLPAGFQAVMFTVSNMIIQSNINSFGTDTVAAWAAYSKIDAIYWMIMASFGISVTTFVGQNYGAGKYDRVNKGIKICILMSLLVAITVSLTFNLSSKYLYKMFTDDINVINIGLEILKFLSPFYFLYVFIEIFSGSLRGMGNSILPMVITSFGVAGTRVLWVIFIVPLYRNMKTVITCYPLSWAITAALFSVYFYYYSRKYIRKENKVIV